ncbi:PREDICTED: telomere repeats-binding bouquet formation protein 1-like isoform X1 [Acropora digitifera]|uniref:telomere repeats-binding bouquet formation protein 1-like isoform X1 n=1 Tax=Acropora digitifera TaxID=70779 RepID=UPI00077A3831|nr:PREDICTED: telomere repeats-binding bouquet formation protein 1-like isoform X1 [Acropora digitifera]
MLRSRLQAKNSSTTATAAFLLLTICADNGEGQSLARETKCLHSLCALFKSCLAMHKEPSFIANADEWFSNMDESSIQLWKTVIVALQSLLQNPQNAQNQVICCRLLPMIVNLLQLATKQREIIRSTTTLLRAIVTGNSECQSKVRLLGGLRALVNVLKECINEKQLCDQDLHFIEHVVSTIGSATAGHGMCQESTAELGLVSLLVKCLEMSSCPSLSSLATRQFRTKCILALSICVEQCDWKEAIVESNQRDRIPGCETQIPHLTQEAETQTESHDAQFVCGAGECGGSLTKVPPPPPRDAETQTEHFAVERVGTEQSNGCVQVATPPEGQAITEESQQSSRTTIHQKSRCVSVKVLKPLANPWNIRHRRYAKSKDLASSLTKTPRDDNKARCEFCASILNSRNFMSTLKSCKTLCTDHEQLKGKLKDLRRQTCTRL